MAIVGVLGIIVILGTIIFVHECGHFIVAKLSRMRVDEFAMGFGPALWSKKRGDTLYAIRAVPLGGYVRIAGMEPGEEQTPDGFFQKPFIPKFFTIAAGALMNFVLALVLMIVLGMAIGYPLKEGPAIIDGVQPKSPAATAGIKAGDMIVAIGDTQPITNASARDLIRQSDGPIPLTLERQGQQRIVTVTPKIMETADIKGISIKRVQYRGIGIVISTIPQRVGVVRSIQEGWYTVGRQIQFAAANVLFIFSGQAKFSEVGGPVMVARASYDVSKDALTSSTAMAAFLGQFALFSVLIGFFNLLPIPALDGGRLFSLVVEEGYQRVSGKQFDRNKEAMVHMVGMVLLLALVLLITVKDVWQLFKG